MSDTRDGASSGDSLVEGVTLLLLLSLFQRIVGFVRNVLVCRYLDPDELGRWNLAFNVLTLAAPMLVLGIPGTFGRYVEHFRQRGQLRSFLRRAGIASLITATLGLALMCLARDQLTWLVFRDPNQTNLMAVSLVVLTAVVVFNYLVNLLTALRQPKVLSYLNFLNSLLFTGLAIATLVFSDFGAMGVVAAFGLSSLLSLLAGIRLLSRRSCINSDNQPLLRRDLWAKLAPFASWLFINDLLANLFSVVDRSMIVHFSTEDAQRAVSLVGQYHSSRILGVLVIAFAEILSSVLLPYLSHDWESGRFRQVGQQINFALKLIAISLTGLCALMVVVAPTVFETALGGKYTAGLRILPITLTYCIWQGLFLVAQNYMWLTEKAKYANLSILIALIGNCVLNYFLLPSYGLAGAVVATNIANILALTLILYYANKLGLSLDRGTLLSLALPVCLWLGAAPAVALTAGCIWLGIRRRWLLSANEIQQLAAILSRYTAKLGLRRKSVAGGRFL